jgi:hypothetical protein
MYKTPGREESFQPFFFVRCFVMLYVTFLERSKFILSLRIEVDGIPSGYILRAGAEKSLL